MKSLEFEEPIVELEQKINELQQVATSDVVDLNNEVQRLEKECEILKKNIYDALTPWQVVQVARHPKRPHSLDYINRIFTEFDELHGDRCFADDKAIVGGLARLNKKPVVVIGQQKGRNTKENIARNFGMAHPEGYRKAARLMRMAEKFKLPVITLIDTMGAYPGVASESRGISKAIASNLSLMSDLKVPIVSVVIGEGTSGGAIGIGVADRVYMLQYSYYATISPEACSTIIYKDLEHAIDAANIMRITADKVLDMGIIDDIIEEPLGGAHRNWDDAANSIKNYLSHALDDIELDDTDTMLEKRYAKLMRFGVN